MQTEATLAQADVSELDLVRRCQAGDTEAFDELVTRYRTRVFGMIYNMIHSEQDAWDLAQDSFVKERKSIRHPRRCRKRMHCRMRQWSGARFDRGSTGQLRNFRPSIAP